MKKEAVADKKKILSEEYGILRNTGHMVSVLHVSRRIWIRECIYKNVGVEVAALRLLYMCNRKNRQVIWYSYFEDDILAKNLLRAEGMRTLATAGAVHREAAHRSDRPQTRRENSPGE